MTLNLDSEPVCPGPLAILPAGDLQQTFSFIICHFQNALIGNKKKRFYVQIEVAGIWFDFML